MPTYQDVITALPVGSAADKAVLRAAIVKRTAYCLTDAESLQNITVVDPDAGTVPLYVIQSGRLFEYDAADTTTAHDGTTCLVSADTSGKRYKVVSFDYPSSVLDKDLTAPPGSPAVGDGYIVAAAATGAWSGKDAQVAVYTERGWNFATVPIGRAIYVEDETSYYHLNAGGAWIAGLGTLVLGAGVVKPSSLIGAGARVNWVVENQTTNTPPAVTDGVAYIIGSAPTGAWAGHAAKIAHGENSAWVIYTPAEGWSGYDKALDKRLTYTGAAWQAGADAWVLIQTQVASDSATIDFVHGVGGCVLDDTYDSYLLVVSNAKPVTDDVTACLRIGTGAGPTWQTSGYSWNTLATYASSAFANSTSDGQMVMSYNVATAKVGNAAGESYCADIRFDNPEASDFQHFEWHGRYVISAGTLSTGVFGGGRYNSAGAITGLRFLFFSGNIAAGRFSLYGLRKS